MLTFDLKFNKFNNIAEQTHVKIDQLIRKCAFDIEARAKANAPVDTGALRASIHVVTNNYNGYGKAAAEAKGRMKPVAGSGNISAFVQDGIFREVHPNGPHQAIVAVAMEYGIYVEMGTVHIAARPYFIPAFEAIRPTFQAGMRALLK